MEEVAVGFLLENLKQLLLHEIHLIGDAKNQVMKLENDLRRFKAFLKDSTKKRRKDEGFAELVRQIREAVYEAEDIIDTFVTEATSSKSKNYILNLCQTPVNLHGFAREVEAVSSKFLYIQTNMDFSNLIIEVERPAANQAPQVRPKKVVGFEDEADKLIECLNQKTDQLEVISIVGMPGLGKTTLAAKIFWDPAIRREFETFIWVTISSEFTERNVFLTILGELIELTKDIYRKNDQQLARMVEDCLGTKKFLIVMDDIWTTADWDLLEIALPKSNNMGKVLITSRHPAVARHANRDRIPHELRFLTPEESWLLLKSEVFGKLECPPDLELLAKPIVKQCDRLPLAIVVIGGILAERFSAAGDIGAKKDAWRNVSKSVRTYLSTEDPTRQIEKVMGLSYNKLPTHLRPCFLYFGMFPEDFEISAWKLTRMWIAEGFIQPSEISLEETADNYLGELINKNLVRIEKRKRDGKVKTCRIHDMLWDFCKNEAESERENFLHQMKKSSEGTFNPSVANIEKHRRLCIHSNVLKFVSLKPHGPRVRSFVCCSKEEIIMPKENNAAIPSAFKLLRILEAKPIKFTKIPSDMYQLIHLRYIVLSINLTIIPSAFSKFEKIQTLIVDTPSPTLDIKANVWKMLHLRHLKTNASTTLPKIGKDSKEAEELPIQTLGTISPRSCTEEVLSRTCNIKSLGIRGQLAMFMDAMNGSFHHLGKLNKLEKLKLMNDVSQLSGLPPHILFPPQLRSLTLSGTLLAWEHMSVLGQLENLLILKLKDKAFVGECWNVAIDGFEKLDVLYVDSTDLKTWKLASKDHLPKLRCLELRNCDYLEEIPIQLAYIESFQILNLYRAEAAVASANKILEERLKIQGDQTVNFNEFKLSVSY